MFQEALIESGRPRHAGQFRRMPVGIAIAVHAAAAALVIGSSLWNAEEAPEPAIPIVFHEALPPPPLGDGAPARTETAPVRSHPAAVLATPARIPDRIDTASVPANREVETREGQEGDDGPSTGQGSGGDPNGIPGGLPGSTEKAPPIERELEILRPGGDVKAPALVLRIDPVYPESMRRAHVEGVVILDAVISAAGVVEEVRVVKSVNPVLDAAAVRAVEGWRYRAATLNGRAVKVWLNVTVTFGLH